jgi:cell division protein FtsI (penicillin-binding protein 3)
MAITADSEFTPSAEAGRNAWWIAPPAPVARKKVGRIRYLMVIGAFALVYSVIAGKLVYIATFGDPPAASSGGAGTMAAARPDLVDRNGEVLATDIKSASLFAEPRKMIDKDEAAESIAAIVPGLEAETIRDKIKGNAGFAWLKRQITPEQQAAIHRLGIPGIGFITENRRFYPGGSTSSHILGSVNIDNQGIAGIEKYIDDSGLADLHSSGFATKHALAPVKLSIDLRVQHVLHDELADAVERYKAIAGTGVILDVHTGEVLAMVSLPDFDPNNPAEALQKDRINRMTQGVFELGSVFKTFTIAGAFDSGKVKYNDIFDAAHGITIGHKTITDFHGKHRPLSVEEVFIYSSNLGAARIALAEGGDYFQDFLRRIGMGTKVKSELPEMGSPLWPHKWSEASTVTVAFGHGIAVTPMHAAVAAAALVNGGKLIEPTFLVRDEAEADKIAKQVVKPETSALMRRLFRANVERGSGKSAEVRGYYVGGKTGTAEKLENGKYSTGHKNLNSFLAAFPMDAPRYVVLITIDEPKSGCATAACNAAPTVAAVVRRTAPMLGVAPRMNINAFPVPVALNAKPSAATLVSR